MRLLQRNSKGQVLVLVALMMVVLLGVAALAIDVGMAYGLKAKLNAAVDAAAIAALRERTSATGSESSAEAVAKSYFDANFRYQEMGVNEPVCVVKIDSHDGGWVATVSATTTLPTRFAHVIGWNNLTVSAKSEATKSDVDIALVVDTTDSLQDVFGTVKDRTIEFVNRFNETYDRLALVPFGTGVTVVDKNGVLEMGEGGVDIKTSGRGFSKSQFTQAINNLTLARYTASEFGMRMGVYQLQKVTNPAAQRAIVFFSDGAPNTFTAKFPLDASGATATGSLFSGTGSGAKPELLYKPQLRADAYPSSISLHQVPLKGGGYNIGAVQIPEVSIQNDRRPISFYGNSNPDGQKCDVNKAARNLLENIANSARSQGIIIFSLGYGPKLDQPDISGDCSTSTEKGSDILRRIANTVDSDTYNPRQPAGLYCYAETINDLGPCYNAIANALLRLSK